MDIDGIKRLVDRVEEMKAQGKTIGDVLVYLRELKESRIQAYAQAQIATATAPKHLHTGFLQISPAGSSIPKGPMVY